MGGGARCQDAGSLVGRSGLLFAMRLVSDCVMYKMQMFQEVIEAVAMETEIGREKILSGCKEEEVIDARSLLIQLMYDKGLYPIQISRITGICQRSVNRFLMCFSCRCQTRKMLGINYDNLRKKLGLS